MGDAEKSYEEIVDLFARGGGAGAVLAFRPSAEAKARVQELLARNKQGVLSEDEQAEHGYEIIDTTVSGFSGNRFHVDAETELTVQCKHR